MARYARSAAFAAGVLSLLAALPAAADFRREEQLALAPGGEIVLDVHGSVTITGGATSGASVVVTADSDDVQSRYDFSFGASGNRAEVKSVRRGGVSNRFRFRGENLHFEVRVPRETRVDVDTSGGGVRISHLAGAARLRSSGGGLYANDVEGPLDAETSGGGVEVRQARGEIRLETSGGGIRAYEVTGNLAAETSGGGIEIEGVDGDVTASTSGGGVRVDDVSGKLVAHSSGGPVTASFGAGASAGGSLSSSGGGVRVELDPAARLTIDARSSGGSVACDLPITIQGTTRRSELRGDLNGGGAPLVLRSSGGGIRIDPTGGR
jgi:DUF4097 and DUF4098 domain-containing protein YvlB